MYVCVEVSGEGMRNSTKKIHIQRGTDDIRGSLFTADQKWSVAAGWPLARREPFPETLSKTVNVVGSVGLRGCHPVHCGSGRFLACESSVNSPGREQVSLGSWQSPWHTWWKGTMKRDTCHLVSQKPGVLTSTTEDSLMVTGCLGHFQWVLKKKKIEQIIVSL